jgi:hypothetical protein
MENVYSEVSVYCWRTKASTIDKGKKLQEVNVRARSFKHDLQLLARFTVKEVRLFYIFLITPITR